MRTTKVKIKVPENCKKKLIEILEKEKLDFPCNIDGFLYIVSKIIQLSVYNKKYQKFKKVPLYSKILRKELGKHYKRYLEFLIDRKFITTDNHYIVSSQQNNGKCKGYALREKYKKGSLVDHEITKETLLNKILTWRREYLGKNINDDMLNKLYGMLKNFSIDIDGAKKWLESMYEKGEISEKVMKMEIDKCERINSKDTDDLSLFITKDNYSRVHTNFTNLSKNIREKFLFMDEKKVIGIDIVSSQAALLHSLFDQQLTKLDIHSKKSIIELLDMNPPSDTESKYQNMRAGYRGIHINDQQLNESIPEIKNKTLDEFINASRKELKKYECVLQTEGVYEYFMDKWELLTQDTKKRKFIKNQWITYVFGRGKTKLTETMHRIWEIEFPNLTILLNHLKKGDYKALAHTLQRIEADIIYNKVCPRIDSEYKVPYCTVHDSIIVSEDIVDDVAYLFDKVLEENGILTGVSY